MSPENHRFSNTTEPVGDLRYYGLILARRWRLLVATVVGIAALAIAYATWSPKRFTGETVILIERTPHNVIDIDNVIGERGSAIGHGEFYNTQYELLKSRSLAEIVIHSESLWMDVDLYLRRLVVEPIPDSRLVSILFTDANPEVAASVANAHAAAFIQKGRDDHARATSGAHEFLDQSMEELEGRLRESERALAAFRRENEVISQEESSGLVIGRIGLLNDRLGEAARDRVHYQTQIRFIEENGAGSLPEIRDNAAVVELRGQLNELVALRDAGNVPTIGIGDKINDLRRRLNAEIQAAAGVVRSNWRTARDLEGNLKAELDREKRRAVELKDVSAEYAILEREVESNRTLYNDVLKRRKELGMSAVLQPTNVSIVDVATVPSGPSNLSPAKVVSFGILFALLASVGLAFAADYFDRRVKTPEELEEFLALPHLGSIPHFLSGDTKRRKDPRTSGAIPVSAVVPASQPVGGALVRSKDPRHVLEGYRAIRTAILLSRAGEPPRTMLISSARKGEGKTITALNVAAMFRQMRSKVLIVDADLRSPSCRSVLGLPTSVGLTEVLAGHCEPGDAIQDIGEGFSFLDAGAETPPDPVELLGSDRMRQVIKTLQKSYEYIVFDGPPLLPVSDSVALSPLVDGVVMVVDQETPKPVMARAHAKLEYARARVIGVVLNRSDSWASEPYGYPD